MAYLFPDQKEKITELPNVEKKDFRMINKNLIDYFSDPLQILMAV